MQPTWGATGDPGERLPRMGAADVDGLGRCHGSGASRVGSGLPLDAAPVTAFCVFRLTLPDPPANGVTAGRLAVI